MQKSWDDVINNNDIYSLEDLDFVRTKSLSYISSSKEIYKYLAENSPVLYKELIQTTAIAYKGILDSRMRILKIFFYRKPETHPEELFEFKLSESAVLIIEMLLDVSWGYKNIELPQVRTWVLIKKLKERFKTIRSSISEKTTYKKTIDEINNKFMEAINKKNEGQKYLIPNLRIIETKDYWEISKYALPLHLKNLFLEKKTGPKPKICKLLIEIKKL